MKKIVIMTSKNSSDRYTADFEAMMKLAILNSLGFFFLGFFVPIIARTNMNATGLQIGWITSSLVIGHLVSSTFVGILTDRIEKRRLLIFIGCIGRGTSYFLIYFGIIINSLSLLWMGYATLGFGAGFFWIPFDTIVAEKSNKNHRAHAFGKRDSANAVGQLIGALIGFGLLMLFGIFTDNVSVLYSVIIFYGIANYFTGFMFFKKIDESIKFNVHLTEKIGESTEINKLKSLFSATMVIGLIILFTLVLLSSTNANIWRPFINIFIIETINDDLNIVIFIYLPAGILATLFAPKLGSIIDKFNPTAGIVITSLLGALMTWLLINTKVIWIFAIIVMLDLAIAMAAGLIFRNLLSRINIKHRGKILGMTNTFTNVGAIIGPIFGGFLWDTIGRTAPFVVSIYVELCLIPLYLIVVRILVPHVAETYEKAEK